MIYFHSFSYKGVNQGCCVVEADTEKSALQKTIDLGLHPKHDDIKVYFNMDAPEDCEFELNRMYSREEMMAMDNVENVNE